MRGFLPNIYAMRQHRNMRRAHAQRLMCAPQICAKMRFNGLFFVPKIGSASQIYFEFRHIRALLGVVSFQLGTCDTTAPIPAKFVFWPWKPAKKPWRPSVSTPNGEVPGVMRRRAANMR